MEEIINSVMQTPDNTNPNVLRSQLQGMASSSTGGVLVVHRDENGVLDKTWKEINDAPLAVLKLETGQIKQIKPCSSVGIDDGDYFVIFGDNDIYSTNSENGYPVTDGR